MPYLKIQTNQTISADSTSNLLKAASSTVADLLGKPERYVMVAYEPPVPMVFGGRSDPCAYMELKSIGLNADTTATLSAALCELATHHLQIPADRVYIEFANATGNMWGWNGDTF